MLHLLHLNQGLDCERLEVCYLAGILSFVIRVIAAFTYFKARPEALYDLGGGELGQSGKDLFYVARWPRKTKELN